MSTLSVACACGSILQVRAEHAGRRAVCPSCRQTVLVPLGAFPAVNEGIIEIESDPLPQALKPPPIDDLSWGPEQRGGTASGFWDSYLLVWIVAVSVLGLASLGASLEWPSSKQHIVPSNSQSLAHLQSGYAWRNKNENDKAIAEYNEAIRLDPNNAVAYVDRGIAWKAKNEQDKAIADFTEAIRIDP